MDVISEQAVRERAYALWVEAGMVHGRDRVHWLAAEAEVGRVGAIIAAAVPNAAKSTKAKLSNAKPVVTAPVGAATSKRSVSAASSGRKAPKAVTKVAGKSVAGATGTTQAHPAS